MASLPELSPLKLALTGLYLLFWPALVFLLAGDWGWIYGWLFALWFVALCSSCMIWLYRHDPALLAERYRPPGTGGQQGWDRFAVYAIFLLFITWIVVMPLDAKRFHWTPDWPAWARVLGALALFGASFLLFRSFTDNTYLSPLVRIQAEREHKLVSTGVYGFVRHPMYLGAVLLFCGVPALLGSALGMSVGILSALLLALRILGEERLLVRELDGYTQYQQRVRYRLLPLVW